MKTLDFKLSTLPFSLLSLILFTACSNELITEDPSDDINVNESLSETDQDALLFMLEEEKLARDTYFYLDDLWSINQFANIKNSEQKHMDAVEVLLQEYNIAYTILPAGEYENTELQELYNSFVDQGKSSLSDALQIGATIEDLDIVDLENNIKVSENQSIINVFQQLLCGSRNHLRAFVMAIESNQEIYIPQFLNIDDFEEIINGSHESCHS